MSSEVVKKRGRPKKVIAEILEVEVPEVAKKTTRAKSTKAAPKSPKVKASSTAKTSSSKIEAIKSAKPVEKSIAPVVPEAPAPAPAPVAAKDPPLPLSSSPSATPNAAIGSQTPEIKVQGVAPTLKAEKGAPPSVASPILAEVQKLKEKSVAAEATNKPKTASTESVKPPPTKIRVPPKNPPPTTSTSTPPPPPPPITSTTDSKSHPPPSPPPPPPASKPTPPKPRLPIAALNSAIVSNISTRAGARPNTAGSKQLPQNYKAVSRKVTMAIVAMPIMIVTSYVLYQRLVLGEERKLLVKDPPPADSPTSANASPS